MDMTSRADLELGGARLGAAGLAIIGGELRRVSPGVVDDERSEIEALTGAGASVLRERGHALASALDRRAQEFHVRSDEHEILLWESSVVRARLEHALGSPEPAQAVSRSVLLAASSRRRFPRLIARLRAFYEACDRRLASSGED